ncbi:ATP-binding protein [Konateibacter massiliensis]|uniref:ATP-binding protein n=1 Tax=Konateibacter massiliensis TaxID=2002841 RepID=UPI0015D4C606|nr:SbcC/MukB-like Walker B domain-containing protein [Konateibacter massiliensis]
MTAFQAMTRMCLNNWHYINEKVLSFSSGINFFTGHSGSGKSTVLDALQLLLYVDTNGRGFFNKAAKDDSDRTLMEYLRGMKVVQENDEAGYLRNQNFSTTIVLEFENVEKEEYQCIGVVFDVDVTSNDADRMFFWHKGRLLTNRYRLNDRTMSIRELKDWLGNRYDKEQWDYSRTNEKFRAKLYETYLGGLDEKKFPSLFKKAIPFRMNMKLEDFVKNYICMEKNIHIEDMQDSVIQYVRLRRRLEDTKQEITLLEDVREQYGQFQKLFRQSTQFQYNIDKLDIYTIEQRMKEISQKQTAYQGDLEGLTGRIETLAGEVEALQKQRDTVMIAIENSGYTHLESELNSLNQLMEFLYESKTKYDKIGNGLQKWLETDLIPEDTKLQIESFLSYHMDTSGIKRIKENIRSAREQLLEEQRSAEEQKSLLEKEVRELKAEIGQLKAGDKAYPSYLMEAKDYIQKELQARCGVEADIYVLADLLQITDSEWQNAVEGYMGNHKLSLIAPPQYTKTAIEIYHSMDEKKYYKVSVIDSDRVLKASKPVLEGALAEVVDSSVDYAKAFVDFLMGSVIRCGKTEQLRQNKSAVTKDCLLYHNYKLQHMNPKNYTEFTYIGKNAIEQRRKRLESRLAKLVEEKLPFEESVRQYREILSFEALQEELPIYEKYLEDMRKIQARLVEKESLEIKINDLKTRDIQTWKDEKQTLEDDLRKKTAQKEQFINEQRMKTRALHDFKEELTMLNGEIVSKEKGFVFDAAMEENFQELIRQKSGERPERLKNWLINKKLTCDTAMNVEYEKLIKVREGYQREYSFRGFTTTGRENKDYEQLLEMLQSDKLSEFTGKAAEQANIAIHHFKTDFIYKIRDSIKEAMQQKEELNRILANSDFGKEKYRFIITKNKGEDGKFYNMFMDENLEVNPTQLSDHMENQMDLFSKGHSENYAELINELIEVFMPPENSDTKELEEARYNMEKYADYRTYLSFDMEQLIDGMPPMRLSKMLSKNSGGEGQNPLYIALLASFAQVYKINTKESSRRNPTLRLVVLDEAFSKMDGEKVGSCVELIRKMGFQAIISATNDKLQNYVDYVDKTFVFANPNKNHISIQPFEKLEFSELLSSHT